MNLIVKAINLDSKYDFLTPREYTNFYTHISNRHTSFTVPTKHMGVSSGLM